jgi:hypothetical protein
VGKGKENITAVVRYAWYLGALVTLVGSGFYFVCGGGSLCWRVRVCLLLGARKGGFYGRWVFMRVSTIAFGYTVWFSFKRLFAVNSVWM